MKAERVNPTICITLTETEADNLAQALCKIPWRGDAAYIRLPKYDQEVCDVGKSVYDALREVV